MRDEETMTADIDIEIPVFLPGNNRDWTKVDGRARIIADGRILIALKPEDAVRLNDSKEKP
jgi:hypothetical protein